LKVSGIDNDRWGKVRRIWEIIDRLRGEGGCPWDRKQTPEKVQTYLIEEAHEAASAVRAGEVGEAAEELGDLLFMVLFLIHLYEEHNDFRLDEVCDLISEKMVRRHPHVFGDTTVHSAQEVRDNWERIKAGEKAAAGKASGTIPESLPALMRAYRMISRQSQSECPQWNNLDDRVEEFGRKSRDLGKQLSNGAPVDSSLFGELLAGLVNLARIEGYRAEDCLHDWLHSPSPPAP
jgi:MazG family protein